MRWLLVPAIVVVSSCVNAVDDGDENVETDAVVNPGGEQQELTMPACGTTLATFEGVAAKSNGIHTGTGISCAGQGGIAGGLQYQCVELVMRFFKTKWDLRWHGNAKDLLTNAPRTDVDVFYNGDSMHKPVPGDMLVWTDGEWGHTALVTNVTAHHVDIIEQNVPGNGTFELPYDGATIGSRWGGWVPHGWAHAKANHATSPPPAPTSSCGSIAAVGGVLDESNDCVTLGGTPAYLHASTEGYGSDLVFTYTSKASSPDNFAKWEIKPARAGTYRVDVFTDTTVAASQQAKYAIVHDGVTAHVVVDQSAHNGFRSLGSFAFAASGDQHVRLDDNTGEFERKIVFDALRFVPACSSLHVETTNATLHVRSAPSTSATILGSLDAGVNVTRMSTVDGSAVDGDTIWHKVQHGSLVGYASGKFLACPP